MSLPQDEKPMTAARVRGNDRIPQAPHGRRQVAAPERRERLTSGVRRAWQQDEIAAAP